MLFKRNEIWYYKFTINGKTIYRSTGTANKVKAQEIADKVKAKTWDQLKGEAKNKFIFGKKPSSDTCRKLIKKALMTIKPCCAGLHNTLTTSICIVLTRP